ncbi:hypothetical protein P389DRAFT_165058 [Cystobasidium minutum MCA 4210]|uniref:uncharacterized protein n=1 Tax=Cystobasidium minutum MCA 4210 TaxID=1397322 RepID=UPI0034CD1039|eukprot:jgi/Rhomi1/165058/fgenesh1_kg.1_\
MYPAALNCGWTVRLEDLYYHAYAYHAFTRNFRLIRKRQATMTALQTENTLNLLHLPREIFDATLNEANLLGLEEARYTSSIDWIVTKHGCLQDQVFKDGNPVLCPGSTTPCGRCTLELNHLWLEAARFDELGRDVSVHDPVSMSPSQIITRYLSESSHMALKLAPLLYNETFSTADWLAEQLRRTVFVIFPRSSSHTITTRQYFAPDRNERLYTWKSHYPHSLTRLPAFSPLKSLISHCKMDVIMLAEVSNGYTGFPYGYEEGVTMSDLPGLANGYWQPREAWTYAWNA